MCLKAQTLGRGDGGCLPSAQDQLDCYNVTFELYLTTHMSLFRKMFMPYPVRHNLFAYYCTQFEGAMADLFYNRNVFRLPLNNGVKIYRKYFMLLLVHKLL